MGYKIIWEPKSKIEHQHESSFRRLGATYISHIKERNELLFTWKNISDPQLVASHIQFLIGYTLTHPGYLKIILAALKQVPKLRRPPGNLSDKSLFQLVNQTV